MFDLKWLLCAAFVLLETFASASPPQLENATRIHFKISEKVMNRRENGGLDGFNPLAFIAIQSGKIIATRGENDSSMIPAQIGAPQLPLCILRKWPNHPISEASSPGIFTSGVAATEDGDVPAIWSDTQTTQVEPEKYVFSSSLYIGFNNDSWPLINIRCRGRVHYDATVETKIAPLTSDELISVFDTPDPLIEVKDIEYSSSSNP